MTFSLLALANEVAVVQVSWSLGNFECISIQILAL